MLFSSLSHTIENTVWPITQLNDSNKAMMEEYNLASCLAVSDFNFLMSFSMLSYYSATEPQLLLLIVCKQFSFNKIDSSVFHLLGCDYLQVSRPL